MKKTLYFSVLGLAFLTSLAVTYGSLFKPLEHLGVVDRMKAAFGDGEDYGFLTDKLPFSEQISLFTKLQSVDPKRVKRAATQGDESFIQAIQDTLRPVARKLTHHCKADLFYYLRSLLKFTVASAKMNMCQVTEVGKDSCECLNKSSAIVEEHMWTISVLDALGKLPSGVLHGNMWFLGDFQQCVGIEVAGKDQEDSYRGKYCMVKFGFGKNGTCPASYEWNKDICGSFGLSIGICVPDTCIEDDLNLLITSLLYEFEIFPPTSIEESTDAVTYPNETRTCMCVESQCKVRNLEYDGKAAFMLVIIGLVVILMAIGTAYDYWVYGPQWKVYCDKQAADTSGSAKPIKANFWDEQAWLVQVFLAFSVLSNGRKLLDTTKRPGQVHCLHGLRFFSLSWVIFGHTYYWIIPTLDNLIGVKPLTKHILNQIILNATFCVDCFFMLSGFLLTYLWLKDTSKTKGRRLKSPVFWIMFYVHRFIRLTPVYMLILGMDVTLYRYVGKGPFWNQDGLEPNYCRRSWWTNLLYVNNFFVQDELCMSWTWYLANDFQFYAFSPFILMLLWKFEIAGLVSIVGLIFGTGAIKGWITVANDFPPTSMASTNPKAIEIQARYWEVVYVKPYCRCGAYLVGMLLGYLLFKCGKKRVSLPKWGVGLGWLLCTVVQLALLFGLYEFSRTGDLPATPANFLYAMLARPLWCCGLAWIIFACVMGYGGPVNDILSWGPLIPLSRLTFCAYLLHPLVCHGTYSSRFQSAHFDTHLRMVYNFFGHMVFSYSLAFLFCLAFESPVLSLEKILFKTNRGKQAPPEAGNQDTGPQSPVKATPKSMSRRHSIQEDVPPTQVTDTTGMIPQSNQENGNGNDYDDDDDDEEEEEVDQVQQITRADIQRSQS